MINENVFRDPEYTADATFNDSVTNAIVNYTTGTGTVTSIIVGTGLSGNPNPITTTGVISLNAGLSTLNGVNFPTDPNENQVLTYIGGEWTSKTFGGTGTSPITFLDLSDTPSSYTGHGNYYLAVNAAQNAVGFVANDNINTINAGEGIGVVQNTNTAQVRLEPSNIITTINSNDNDNYIIEKSNGDIRRIEQKSIKISGFHNNSNFINLHSLTATAPLSYTPGLSIGTFGICASEIPIDFTGGVIGILGIPNGGTSASTGAGARQNLGLVYNVDILTATGPSFSRRMVGDNIHLRPQTFGLSILGTGSGYVTGDATLQLSGFDGFNIDILTTGGSGNILTFGPSSVFEQGLYPDYVATWGVSMPGGTGASVQVTPEINYINFGISTGSDGIGFRNNYGTVEVRTNGTCAGASTWRPFFPLTLNDLEDVSVGTCSGDILIYQADTAQFQNKKVTGVIILDNSGTVTFDGTGVIGQLSPNAIAGGTYVSSESFSYLEGVTSNIQIQLDDKIGTSIVDPIVGDLIYYSGTSSWQPLRWGAGTSRQIVTSYDGVCGPKYEYLPDIPVAITTIGASSSSLEMILVNNAGPGEKVSVIKVLDECVTGVCGGITLNSAQSHIIMNINNLHGGSIVNGTTDELAYYHQSNTTTEKITVKNFCQQISGNGLSVASDGKINIDGTSSQGVNLGFINLHPYTFSTSPSAPPAKEGSLAFFTDGSAGQPCLSVYYGTCWQVVGHGLCGAISLS